MTPAAETTRSVRLPGVLLAAALGLGFGLSCVRAETPAAAFDAANRLYAEGKYRNAAGAFEQLRATGVAAAALDFNLGNALFKSGQIGRAIAAYRAAERIAPRDPDVRANLQFARNQVEGPTRPVNRWERWFSRLTVNEWTGLAATGFWLGFLLLALGQWRPGWRPRLRAYVMASATGTLLGAAGLVMALRFDRGVTTAIVVQREVVVRSSPFEESESAFNAHDGAEFDVLDAKDNWLQITDGGKRIGWIKRDAVLLLGAPKAGATPPPAG